MTSRKQSAVVAVFLGLGVALALGLARTASANPSDAADRPLGHRVLLGAGATWTDPGQFRHTVYPGGMLGFDLGLGRHAAIGLLGDFTYIDERPTGPPPVSTNHRAIT